jgi:hypothetical protein
MKTLRGLLESLVKSGAWGSLQEGHSTEFFRRAREEQEGKKAENERMRIAVDERIAASGRRRRRAEERADKEKRQKAGREQDRRRQRHAKKYAGEVETLKGLNHGEIASVVVRDKPDEEHHVVQHQGSFFLVGPKGNTRQIGNFSEVINGAIKLTNIPKGRQNAKTFAEIEVGDKKGIVPKKDLKYTMKDGKIIIHQIY